MRCNMILGEGPDDPLTGQAPHDVRVHAYIMDVVKDEVVAGRLAEYGNHRQQQQRANGQNTVRPTDMDSGARGEAIDHPGGHLL